MYDYVVTLRPDADVRLIIDQDDLALISAASKWCHNNLGMIGTTWDMADTSTTFIKGTFWFQNVKDAVEFKLRFC
ncbi:hypothetical protein JL100_018095 [Skermanella mucosa]|uniref:hypothetical protein n=1 Tax=Skermanella mucosa TaxID=1789672 RepID=UPI00192B7C87|nr:hypothetical protein [Skermanella mucosa]UEM18998.1 hypothetical protein JL100_018095 [Skermanella mucosa]